jgi:GNAT superfamily N-acetyltransferase
VVIQDVDSEAALLAAFPLMRVLRDRVQRDTFVSEVRRQQADGYRLVGGYAEGEIVALAGLRRSHTLSRGEHMFVDDLVTAPGVRGTGYGRQMMRWIAAQAAMQGIPRVYLDSRETAKGFYEKLGFSFLTSTPCWIDVERLA